MKISICNEYCLIFSQAFIHSSIAYLFATLLFKDNSEIAIIALLALSLHGLVDNFLLENKEVIWNKTIHPFDANKKTTLQFICLFAGMFLSLGIIFYSKNNNIDSFSYDIYRNSLLPLLTHNLKVLIACYCGSLIYRSGGIMMIIGWNTLHWGKSFSLYFEQFSSDFDLLKASLIILILLPHLLLEATGYILAGLSGTFISKGVFKYSFQSSELRQVANACVVLMLISLTILTTSVIVEIYFAQNLFNYFTNISFL